jgi:hypothetical protein
MGIDRGYRPDRPAPPTLHGVSAARAARTLREGANVGGDRESFAANRPGRELLKLQPLAGNAAVASLVAQRQPAKKDEDDTTPLRITTANIDDAITIMWKTYQILVRKRRDAVDKLRILVKDDETEPPGVIVALLLQMAAAGVLGPTGMIGAEIANRLINVSAPTSRRRPWKKDPATHAKVANGAIAAVLNTGVSEGLKAAYDALGSPKKKNQDDARELFFLSQRSVLSDKADQVEINFLNTAAGFRDLEANEKGAGVESLRMLQDAVLKTLSDAEQLQQDESLKAWLSYEANEALGTHEPSKAMWFANKGADLSKIMGTRNPSGEPRRTAGVLSMEIMLSPDYPDRTAVVKSARVEGLNKAMRKRIESIPIGELHIPIVGWARPWGEAWLSVGVNEGRAPWYSIKGMAPEAALRHLYFKVNMAEFAKMRTKEDFDRITRADMEKSAPYAALRIIEELAPLKLGEAKIPVEG